MAGWRVLYTDTDVGPFGIQLATAALAAVGALGTLLAWRMGRRTLRPLRGLSWAWFAAGLLFNGAATAYAIWSLSVRGG